MPIYDTSYRRIEGVRDAGRLRFLPIAETGLRLFFRRRLPRFLGLAALIPFFMLLVGISAPHIFESFRPEQFPEEFLAFFHLTGTAAYVYLTKMVWIFTVLFTALAGAGLVANDLRANALEIYFSRPLTLFDYFLGKLAVILAILLALTFVPSLLLWITDVTLTDEPGYWLDRLHMVPRLFFASLVISLPQGLVILAVSSLAKTARNAMVVFAGFTLMTWVMGMILAEALDRPVYALVSIDGCTDRIAAAILEPNVGLVRAMDAFNPWLQSEAVVYPILVLCGWGGLALVIVFRRVKGVEVVSA